MDRYPSVAWLREQFAWFHTANLRIDPREFRRRLDDYLANRVEVAGRFQASAEQRPQSQSFYWGHDHDFGDFRIEGLMGERHFWLLARFFDRLGLAAEELRGQSVLDVGCWTGGVSLLLARLGAEVTAIDEAAQYPHALNFLCQSFGLRALSALDRSVYELGDPAFRERFDTIFCLGVVYHLSDPIVGLRRLYHALRPGGRLCLETLAIASTGCVCEYQGPSRRYGISGWNWFVPSPAALRQWLEDTGFEDIRIGNGEAGAATSPKSLAVTDANDPLGPNRCFAVARKRAGHRISVAGLSAAIF